MFTGIIKEVGSVHSIKRNNSLITLGVSCRVVYNEANPGDSIAINGVCLTLVKRDKNILFFEAISSTAQKTNVKFLRPSDLVNIEPALRAQDKMGGHFVLGHVDCVSKLIRPIKYPDFWQFQVELLASNRRHIVENGSIAIEGISLTVKDITRQYFSVNIIPFTYSNTTLKYKKSGSLLNIEFDYLLKDKMHADFR